MPIQVTAVRPEQTSTVGVPDDGALSADVRSLPSTEVAAALYASDMPRLTGPAWESYPPFQIAAWVKQGLARIGGVGEAWRISRRSRRAVERHDRKAFRNVWPSRARMQDANDLAYYFTSKVGTYRAESVWIEVADPSGEGWSHSYKVQVDKRDAEFARIYGEPV